MGPPTPLCGGGGITHAGVSIVGVQAGAMVAGGHLCCGCGHGSWHMELAAAETAAEGAWCCGDWGMRDLPDESLARPLAGPAATTFSGRRVPPWGRCRGALLSLTGLSR